MLSAQMQPGDIVFSYGPANFHWIPSIIKSYQLLQSLFFTPPNTSDVQKIHVFVCVKNSDDDMSIVQINGIIEKYDLCTLDKARVNQNKYEILRSNDQEFSNRLVALVSDKENENIKYTYRSWVTLATGCPSDDAGKTKAGFSLNSNCSMFIAEAINLAQPDCLNSTYLSTYGLLQNLKDNRNFSSIIVMPEVDDNQFKLKTA